MINIIYKEKTTMKKTIILLIAILALTSARGDQVIGDVEKIGTVKDELFVNPDSTNQGSIKIKCDTNGCAEIQGRNNADTATSAMSLNPDGGNIGIGTSAPAQKIHAYVSSGTSIIKQESGSLASGGSSIFMATGKGGNNNERNTHIGIRYYDQTSSGGSNDACGYIYLNSGEGENNYLWFDNSENLRTSTTAGHIGSTNGTVAGDQTSDIRLKNNVMQLEPIVFKYKSGGGERLGFSAQQVKPLLPEVVYNTNDFVEDETGEDIEIQKEKKDKKGQVIRPRKVKKGKIDRLAMRYTEIVPVLVKAIQEQQAQIDSLKAEIEKLKNP
jgi:hypothetical protein